MRLQALTLIAALTVPSAALAQDTIGRCTIFPATNIWNTPVDTLPVDPRSADYIASIGPDIGLHTDFGSGLFEGKQLGTPFVVVPFSQPAVPIIFAPFGDDEPVAHPDESDAGPYPIPPNAPIEGGIDGVGDRHVIVLQQGSCTLFELYKAVPNADGSWNAVSAAKFDLEGHELQDRRLDQRGCGGLADPPGPRAFRGGQLGRDQARAPLHGAGDAR